MIANQTKMLVSIGCFACVLGAADRRVLADEPAVRFEAEIRDFERYDAEHPWPAGGILFVGSSTIRRWDLAQSFPDLPTLNRGFGGSQLSDVLHYFDRIVVPYRPRVVVLYEGDNDLAAGETAEQVVAELRQFVTRLRETLPGTRLIVVSIKPSLALGSVAGNAACQRGLCCLLPRATRLRVRGCRPGDARRRRAATRGAVCRGRIAFERSRLPTLVRSAPPVTRRIPGELTLNGTAADRRQPFRRAAS